MRHTLSAALVAGLVGAPAVAATSAAHATPRAPAASGQTTAPSAGFDGGGTPDLMARTPAGYLYLYRGNGHGGFAAPGQRIGAGWSIYNAMFSPGDFNGDGRDDVLARTSTGDLYLYPGNGAGGFASGRQLIGRGWAMFNLVFGAGDFSGDGHNDLLARTTGGDLYLYRGNGHGGFAAAGQKIGAGWSTFNRTFSPGDFTGDHHPDILARNSSGDLYLYRGNGHGGFAAPGQKIGAGWDAFDRLLSAGDFSGDGRNDVLARTPKGDLYLYRGNGAGGFAAAGQKIGAGWSIFDKIFGLP